MSKEKMFEDFGYYLFRFNKKMLHKVCDKYWISYNKKDFNYVLKYNIIKLSFIENNIEDMYKYTVDLIEEKWQKDYI